MQVDVDAWWKRVGTEGTPCLLGLLPGFWTADGRLSGLDILVQPNDVALGYEMRRRSRRHAPQLRDGVLLAKCLALGIGL